MPDPEHIDYRSARRLQSAVDILVSVTIAMLLWPFPMARAALDPAVHVAGVLIMCVAVQLLYYSVSAAIWQRTLGMRLAGVQLGSADQQPPTKAGAVLWGLLSAVIAFWYVLAPSSACSAQTAERVSRTTVY